MRLTIISMVVLGLTGAAHAGEVRLIGSTQGRFNADAFASTDTLLGLTFSNSTFDNTTVGGQMDLGGDPAPGVNFNNLGSLTLDRVNHSYTGNHFDLKVTFTAPTTITGGQSATFTDILSGSVLNGLGGVFVDFDNTPKTFNFVNSTSSGSFTVTINDVSIAPGHDASITAHITGSQSPVPEPSAIAGIACGMFGLLSIRRKKK